MHCMPIIATHTMVAAHSNALREGCHLLTTLFLLSCLDEGPSCVIPKLYDGFD